MPRLRARRALIALAGIAVLLSGGRLAVPGLVESRLRGRAITWTGSEGGLTWLSWSGLGGRGLTGDSLRLDLLPPQVHLRGLQLDLAELIQPGEAGLAPATHGASLPPLPVLVEGLDLNWGSHSLATGLHGSLAPSPDLEGEGLLLQGGPDTLALDLERPFDVDFASGTASVHIERGEPLRLRLAVPDLSLSHPMIDAHPIGPLALLLEGSLDPGARSAQLLGHLGGVSLSITGSMVEGRYALDLQAGPAALADLVALFGDAIPEARRATLGGEAGAHLHLEGPPLQITVEPSAAGLSARGLLRDPEALRRGRVTWRAPDGAGGFRPRETRPGGPDWISPREAPLLAAAVIAAEDGGFSRHPGYDLAAMKEAIGQWQADGGDLDELRGGSTLSQQLAKNLFLDGKRTLSRKVRELLYALDLEASLGKQGILSLYLNVVETGPDMVGMRAAARTFFLKDPGRLSLEEAAYLAAILPSPLARFTDTYLRGRTPRARLEAVLDRMVATEAISREQANAALSRPLHFVPPG